ncbi:DnaJ homolog subfamily C member 21 [Galdieria sulphuraria]|nr:DnaJ homolog subfamily C member 21 [Galdieria sulphuraria]
MLQCHSMQRDYYEVLQVSNTATLNKNPDRVEEATQQFKEIQHAYAVLSDENERAWYDAHKESILSGKEPQNEDKPKDKEAGLRKATSAPLFECFSSGFYNGYADDSYSFYTRFREVFESLDREERSFMEDVVFAPSFGRSDSSWDDVNKFYNYWENFQTKKPFPYVDKWNLNDAPNREIRRAMEKENRRERQNAKKEFIAAVRNLVRYVKRRDKRVARRRQEELEEENRKQEKLAQEWTRRNEEAEQVRRKLQEERQKLIEEELVHLDELLEELDLENSLYETVPEDIKFTCIVCKKTFRSLSQWENHESSKKHSDKLKKAHRDLFIKNEKLNPLDIRVGKEKITLEQYFELLSPSQEADSEIPVEEEYYIEETDVKSDKEEERETSDNLNGSFQDDILCKDKDNMNSFVSSSEKGAVASHHDEASENDVIMATENKKKERKKRRNKSDKKNETSIRCNVCNETFSSRNKLFEHIRKEGHALRVA